MFQMEFVVRSTHPQSLVTYFLKDVSFGVCLPRLLCRLGGRCVSVWIAVIFPRFWICWRKLIVSYGFQCLQTTDIDLSKIHWSFLLLVRVMRTDRYAVLLVKEHST